MSDDTKHPRTHRWFRMREGQAAANPREERPETKLRAKVPRGDRVEDGQLQEQIRAALEGWPIVVLRLVGKVEGESVRVGRHPARWVRKDLVGIVDQILCTCPGLRCTEPRCTSNRLLGRHGKQGKADGEAWAPFVIRAADTAGGTIRQGRPITVEVVLAGDATREIPRLLEALNAPGQPYDVHPVRWGTVHALVLDDEAELRWRKVDPDAASPPLLPLTRLTEPRLRPSRLTMTFLTATPMARQGERGEPSAELSLVLDRMTRSLGAWMGRTGHRGPRLPVDDILRAANGSKLRSDDRRNLQVPDSLLSAPGARDGGSRPPSIEVQGTTALLGSITWTGDFAGLAPLLRAVQYLGMGPGRQHGLGQVAFR